MRIIITNAQRRVKLSRKEVKDAALKTLKALKLPEETLLSLNFLTSLGMKKANFRFFKKNRVTDVIALGYDANEREKNLHRHYIGDVLIYPYAAKINARRYNNTFKKELTLYIIHGILHLLGFDDISEKDRLVMRRKEEEIARKICTAR